MTRTRLTFFACAIAVGMTMPLPAFAECVNQRIGQIYLPMNLNAPSTPHVVASVMTAKGLFEARASGERDGTSQINFYLNGKELKPTAASELRRETIQCSRKHGKLGALDQFYAALSILRNSVISEAEAAKYVSSYKCTGSGTVEVVLVDTVDRTDGSTTYFFQFKQHGHVCGWAAYTA